MIFLDSSYIKGLILKNDNYNHLSKKIKPYLENEVKVINSTVLIEVLNSIKQNNYDKNVTNLLYCLLDLDLFDFLIVADYEDSMKWFEYYNKSINFADCTIINSMKNHRITRIASFDSDFDKIKGFERVH